MPHPNATKGKVWERYVAKVLGLKRDNRKGLHEDEGDLVGDDLFVVEAKNDSSRSPLQWWKQSQAACLRAGKEWSIVVTKVRMPKLGDPRGFVFMSLEQWAEVRAFMQEQREIVRNLQSQLKSCEATSSRAGGCVWSPDEAHQPKESHPEWRACKGQ